MTPDVLKPWFRVEDGGGDCLYGRWINMPNMDPETIQKTGKIISVTTEDGLAVSTLQMIRFSEPEEIVTRGSAPQVGEYLAAAIRAVANGEDPAAAISELSEEPGQPNRDLTSKPKLRKDLN